MEDGEWNWLQQIKKFKDNQNKNLKFDEKKNSSNFSKLSSLNKSRMDKLPSIQKNSDDINFGNLMQKVETANHIQNFQNI